MKNINITDAQKAFALRYQVFSSSLFDLAIFSRASAMRARSRAFLLLERDISQIGKTTISSNSNNPGRPMLLSNLYFFFAKQSHSPNIRPHRG